MKELLIFVVSLALTVVATLWEAFVITKLWAWFIVPFFGLAPISLAMAVGFSALFALFAYQYIPTNVSKENMESFLFEGLFTKFWIALMALTIGWIATFYL